jgi:hypothetical protein
MSNKKNPFLKSAHDRATWATGRAANRGHLTQVNAARESASVRAGQGRPRLRPDANNQSELKWRRHQSESPSNEGRNPPQPGRESKTETAAGQAFAQL